MRTSGSRQQQQSRLCLPTLGDAPKIENDFGYGCPPGDTHDDYAAFAKTLPSVDSPEVFGLHPNADLAFRNKEVRNLLATILETQPKVGVLPVEVVRREKMWCTRSAKKFCRAYLRTTSRILAALDMSQPLDVFLNQEIQRLQLVIGR